MSQAGALAGKLAVTDAQLELASPVFDQKSFTFRTADADIAFQNRTPLLRNGRGATPTEAGKRLLEHARGILHQVDRARRDVDETK